MTTGTTVDVTKHIPHRLPFKPDSWIPVEEHVLGKPQVKVKVISIGCGFSGLYLNNARRERADLAVMFRLNTSPQDPEYLENG